MTEVTDSVVTRRSFGLGTDSWVSALALVQNACGTLESNNPFVIQFSHLSKEQLEASLGDCRGLPAPLQSMGGHKESDMTELIEVEGWSQILF